MALLDQVLSVSPAPPKQGLQGWLERERQLPVDPTERALLGGLHSDRPAWAFGHGYQAALRRLIPARQDLAALCVSEATGNHPRSIQTQLKGGRLLGHKRFVLLGPQVQTLYVLARTGTLKGRPTLALFALPSQAAQHLSGPPSPLVPELAHGELSLDCQAPAPLPGDGWDRYVKPFRTLEDLYVLLAFCGHLIRLVRVYELPPAELERLLALSLALQAAAQLRADSVALHRALGALLEQAESTFSLSFSELPTELEQRWRRDLRILSIGRSARDRRLTRARA